MKQNTNRKFLSIFISVLFLGVMFIASSIGAKAYASEYMDVAMDMGFNIADVDVDSNGHVYAIDFDTGNIIRMDNYGTNRVVLGTIENAQHIAVDDENQYIYITNGSGVVQRMDINGTDVIDFLTLENTILCVAVDEVGRVYVGATGIGIVRVETDGTGNAIIRSVPSTAGGVSNIAIDDVNEYIYYAWYRRGSYILYRLNIDGSGAPIAEDSEYGPIIDVDVDDDGYVYFTQFYGVFRIGSGLIYPEIFGSITVDKNECIYVSKGQVIHKIMTMTVEQLMAEIRECIVKHIDNGNIVDIGSSLISKFDNFSANFGLENNTAALNQLDAFMNEVSAQRGGQIASDVADALIARAKTLHNIMTDEQSTVEAIVRLKEFIAEHIDYETIEANTAASLISKLDNCIASLDKEDNTAAANQLNAFINEVSAQSGNKISEQLADDLIATAQDLLERIEVPVDSEEAITGENVSTIAEEPQTSADVPIVAENPASIADPIVGDESGTLETVPVEEPEIEEVQANTEEATEANPLISEETEVPTTVEDPASLEAPAVEEGTEALEPLPLEEPQTNEAQAITEESTEANSLISEEAEAPTTVEMPAGVEETQP